MADTITTPDKRTHVLLGNTTPLSIIREYAGEEAANWVRKLEDTIGELENTIEEQESKISELEEGEY